MTLHRFAAAATFMAALLAAPAAGAQDSAAQNAASLQLRSLAATCAACHGTDGRAAPGSSIPPLAGRPREEIALKLRDFKEGRQIATVMQQLSKGYTDAQIDAIAGYFAAQPQPAPLKP